MYNLSHSRSKFKVSTPVEVSIGAGIDSGKKGTVCSHFDPQDGYERRLKNDKDWVPVKLTESGKKTYLPAGYLIIK